eukprot:scaffold12778_cov48-Phaeocystis_antarctica.AAC.2
MRAGAAYLGACPSDRADPNCIGPAARDLASCAFRRVEWLEAPPALAMLSPSQSSSATMRRVFSLSCVAVAAAFQTPAPSQPRLISHPRLAVRSELQARTDS